MAAGLARLGSGLRRAGAVLTRGEALTWPHRMWFAITFVVGIGFCYAFPPFQTNDEDAHWLHMWGVAFGNLRCGGGKPAAASDFLNVIKQPEVRNDPANWRHQYGRNAANYVGSNILVNYEGTACRYPPMPYVVPGLVARFAAFGWAGELRPGSMLRAAYAARITNWILVSLAILLLCRRVPWARNFALFFYSIPELLQQSMAVNTDSFLCACAALLMVIVFGSRLRALNLWTLGLVIGLMTIVKPIYAALAALAMPVFERLFDRYRWRVRDVVGVVATFSMPFIAQWLWMRWLSAVNTEPPGPDYGRTLATKQLAYLHEHPSIVLTLLRHQWRDFWAEDLMKGSRLSIFGAFGWSMFTMERLGYYLLLVAGAAAIGADVIAARPSLEPEPPRPGRWTIAAIAVVGLALVVTLLAIIISMYIYFSGAFLARIGADEVVGVQGRYFLVPILVWMVSLLYLVRRRRPLSRRWAGVPALLTTLALFCCALTHVYATKTVLMHFNGAYLHFDNHYKHY